MRLLKAREYEIGRECTVSSPVGFLVVRRSEVPTHFGSLIFEWRFEGDAAWERFHTWAEADVIDDICDAAADVYRRTGQRKQAPDHPQYIRESMEKIAAEMCLHCHAGMETLGHSTTVDVSGLRLNTCPKVPIDQVIAFQMPNGEPFGTVAHGFPSAAALARLTSGTPRSATGWADEVAGTGKMVPRGGPTAPPAPPMKTQPFWNANEGRDALKRAGVGPLAPSEFPNIPGVPKPDYALVEIDGDFYHRAAASAQWSAQLRMKVAEQKERDAEAARYTPWWSPEEQQGGDL